MTVILLAAMLITLNVTQDAREIVFRATILLALAFVFLGLAVGLDRLGMPKSHTLCLKSRYCRTSQFL